MYLFVCVVKRRNNSKLKTDMVFYSEASYRYHKRLAILLEESTFKTQEKSHLQNNTELPTLIFLPLPLKLYNERVDSPSSLKVPLKA